MPIVVNNNNIANANTTRTEKGGPYRRQDVVLKAKAGDDLAVVEIKAEMHTTKPPARYTEASLVKELEEKGIGRPSTYAPIITPGAHGAGKVKRQSSKRQARDMR